MKWIGLPQVEADRAEKFKEEEVASRKLIAQLQREEKTRIMDAEQQHLQQQHGDAKLAAELNQELNEFWVFGGF